jgi:hypothetical protein
LSCFAPLSTKRAGQSLLARDNDALAQGDRRSLSSIRDLQLGAYVVDMIPDRVVTDLKNSGNLFIRQSS